MHQWTSHTPYKIQFIFRIHNRSIRSIDKSNFTLSHIKGQFIRFIRDRTNALYKRHDAPYSLPLGCLFNGSFRLKKSKLRITCPFWGVIHRWLDNVSKELNYHRCNDVLTQHLCWYTQRNMHTNGALLCKYITIIEHLQTHNTCKHLATTQQSTATPFVSIRDVLPCIYQHNQGIASFFTMFPEIKVFTQSK